MPPVCWGFGPFQSQSGGSARFSLTCGGLSSRATKERAENHADGRDLWQLRRSKTRAAQAVTSRRQFDDKLNSPCLFLARGGPCDLVEIANRVSCRWGHHSAGGFLHRHVIMTRLGLALGNLLSVLHNAAHTPDTRHSSRNRPRQRANEGRRHSLRAAATDAVLAANSLLTG